jgi:hypothetical protein
MVQLTSYGLYCTCQDEFSQSQLGNHELLMGTSSLQGQIPERVRARGGGLMTNNLDIGT